jgi:hypothetical protein
VEPSKLQCLLRSWGHSYEEDTDDVTVYRPKGFNFPLSRGRDGIEFQSGGRAVHTDAGPDDRGRVVMGSWKSLEGDTLDVRLGLGDGASRLMTVIVCDQDVLKVRWQYR